MSSPACALSRSRDGSEGMALTWIVPSPAIWTHHPPALSSIQACSRYELPRSNTTSSTSVKEPSTTTGAGVQAAIAAPACDAPSVPAAAYESHAAFASAAGCRTERPWALIVRSPLSKRAEALSKSRVAIATFSLDPWSAVMYILYQPSSKDSASTSIVPVSSSGTSSVQSREMETDTTPSSLDSSAQVAGFTLNTDHSVP